MPEGSAKKSAAAALLTIDSIHKRYGGLEVLTGLSLDLGAGQIKCIIGPNGCGKSTLFDILCGVRRADEGSFHFDGVRADRLPAWRIARLGMLRKFQVPGVLAGLSVVENLELAWGSVHGRVATLREAQLYDYRFTLAEQLPHGLKQRLELLMLAGRRPKLLLLDEPTAGMTPQETADTAQLIRRISVEHGIAVLAIEHDMHFVRALECPVAVMIGGVVRSAGDYESVRQDPQVRRTYLGDAA